MIHRRSPHRATDAGFTLVELVIAMLILGIIMGPLVSAYVLGIGTVAQSNARTTGSSDAQNIAGFFVNDVASAYRVSTAGGCGSDTIVKFRLGSDTSNASPLFIAYGAASDPAAAADQHLSQVWALTRYACDSTGTILTSTVLSNEMTGAPVLCASLEQVTCASVSSQSPLVTLQVTEWGQNTTDDTYQFSVSGTRRVTA